MKNLLFLLTVLISNQILYSQNKPVYPEPKAGLKRIDLLLPKMEGEENYQVEVRFGIKWNIIECADASFSFMPNSIKEEYGLHRPERFIYYVIENNIGDINQGMPHGCDSDIKVERTILSSQKITIGYPSSRAVPFYIPIDCTLEYRIWKTSNTYTTFDK